MEIAGVILGEKVTVSLTNGSKVTGTLLAIKTYGLELAVVAYKKVDHQRFFPFSNILNVEKYTKVTLGG